MLKPLSAVITAFVLTSSAGHALEVRDGNVILHEVVYDTTLAFEAEKWPNDAHGVIMMIEGPGDYSAMEEFGSKVPSMSLKKYGDLKNGYYDYLITGGTSEKIRTPETFNNGREEKTEFKNGTFSLSGRVRVSRGKIVSFEQGEEKGSEETKPGEEVDDGDEGTKPVRRQPRDEKPSDDGDKG